MLTLWTFLYQVLSTDHSCRWAVAHLLVFLGTVGEGPASARTDPYCKARQRLPEKLVADLARQSGAQLHQQVPPTGLLGGRPIKIADGTTASMPDTPENQMAYPQQSSQKKGLGFPIIRLVGLISLSCGAVLDVAMGPHCGKKTGETALLRQLLGGLGAGDVLLADAYFANYWMIAMLLERGVDLVSHHDGKRKVDWGRQKASSGSIWAIETACQASKSGLRLCPAAKSIRKLVIAGGWRASHGIAAAPRAGLHKTASSARM